MGRIIRDFELLKKAGVIKQVEKKQYTNVTKWIYKGGNMKPHEPITVTIANTGLCPGLEAKLIPVIQRDIQVLNHRMTDIETHEHERS